MNYWNWILFVVIHLILLPLKMFVQVLFKFLWYPGYEYDITKIQKNGDQEEKYNKYLKEVNLDYYLKDADGCKFLCLGYCGIKDPQLSEKYWNLVKSYWNWEEGTFWRIPNKYYDKNFSTDMMSGMIRAIDYRFRTKGLTEDEIFQLKKIFEKTLFTGTPFLFKSNDDSRGNLVDWYSTTPDFMVGMSFVMLAYNITKEKKYRKIYELLRVISLPIQFDWFYGIWLGKVHAVNFFTLHSLAQFYYVGYMQTKSVIFKWALKELYTKLPFNPDIAILWYNISDEAEALNTASLWLDNYTREKKNPLPEFEKKTYFSLKGMEKKEGFSATILPTEHRIGHYYMWEKRPIKQDLWGHEREYFDYIHLYGMKEK